MVPFDKDNPVSRRGAIKMLLATPLAALATQRLLVGCADDEDGGPAETSPEHASTQGSADVSRTSDADEAPDTGSGAGEAVDTTGIPWSSGGTQAMRGDYPDPFGTDAGVACVLTKAMTLGPCYADTLAREDISEGMPGVPMRLSLQIVREDGCVPVSGATVDVWHTKAEGVYSEFGSNSACNPGAEDLTAVGFCRGVQTTDDEGKVHFSSIVPGWYGGRAVHVHFTVRVDGEEYLTSQLFFDDALLDEIEQQVDYEARGARDTRNREDSILPVDEQVLYLLNTAKRADGALHAWKVIALRSSLDEELPSAGGMIGMGGPGFPDLDGGIPGGFPGRPQP